MELDDLKATWAKEQSDLEKRLIVNETLVKKLSLEKSQSNFSKLLETSILGRNLALVYGIISMIVAYVKIEDLTLCIPVFLSGLAMFYSFFQHLPLEHPKISDLSAIDLQKAIIEFQIHTNKYAKFDISIVVFWHISLLPIVVQQIFEINIYANIIYSVLFYFGIAAILLLFSMNFKNIYIKINKQLDENRQNLESIFKFENETI